MGRNVLGSLVVSLGLDAAEFTSGLSKSEYQSKKFADNFNRSIGSINAGLRGLAAGLAGGFSAAAIVSWSKEVVHAAEDLRDLSQSTGSTIESLSRLQNITQIGGGGIDEFNSAIERLAAGMNGSEELSTKTAAALQFLGISARDPAQAMDEIAVKLDKFADGTSKAALARDLFGRSGVRFLATLHDIANAGDISATVTAKQAADAESAAEAWRKLSNQATTLRNAVLSDAVPALANMLEQFVEGRKLAGGFFESLRLFGTLSPFDTTAESLQNLRKTLEDMERTKGGFVQRAITAVFGSGDLDSAVSDVKKQIEFQKLRQRQQIDVSENAGNFDARDIRARQKPALGYVSSGNTPKGPDDDPARKLLEARLKTIDFIAEQEKSALKARESFLDAYYAQDVLSITDYFGARADAAAGGLAADEKRYDDQIAALRAFGGRTAKERADVEVQIIDITRKRSTAEADAARESVLRWFDQQRAAKEYASAVADVATTLQELRGDTVGAGLARLEQQQAPLRSRFAAQGDTASIAALNDIKERTRFQLQLNDAQQKYALASGVLGVNEARIETDRQSGRISEIAYLQQRSELNKAMIPVLEEQLAKQEAFAKASGDPAALLNIQRMRQEIYALAQQTDLLTDKFNNIFGDAFSQGLQDLANGTKSLKDVLKDFGKSVTQQINKVAADQISSQLFGKDGAFAGVGKFFSDAFGKKGAGKDQASAAAESAQALIGMRSSTGLADTALVELATSAQLAAAALKTIAASSGGSSLGSLFGSDYTGTAGGGGFGTGADFGNMDFGGFFANGGMPPRGKISIVGEHGPEAFVPRSSGYIIPNRDLGKLGGGGGDINVYQSFAPGQDTETVHQAAVATGRQVRRATARN